MFDRMQGPWPSACKGKCTTSDRIFQDIHRHRCSHIPEPSYCRIGAFLCILAPLKRRPFPADNKKVSDREKASLFPEVEGDHGKQTEALFTDSLTGLYIHGIPDSVLNKPASLNPEEEESPRNHAARDRPGLRLRGCRSCLAASCGGTGEKKSGSAVRILEGELGQ